MLPTQPIKSGDTWAIGTTTPLPMVGGVEVDRHRDGRAYRDRWRQPHRLGRQHLHTRPHSAQAGPLAAMMTTKVTPGRKAESSLRFNTTLGRLLEFQSSTHLPLELTMKAGTLGAPQPGEKPSVTRGHVGSRIRTELLPAPAPATPKP